MTFATMRALLTMAHGPAVERLEDRTPWGVARAYLPRTIWAYHRPIGTLTTVPTNEVMWGGGDGAEGTLDLTDPGTVNAVKVALALAIGLDPGAMGCAVSWRYGAWGWVLRGTDSSYIMSATIDEQDPIKALVLACQHVIREKA